MLSTIFNKLRKKEHKNAAIGQWSKDEAEYVLLVGSFNFII